MRLADASAGFEPRFPRLGAMRLPAAALPILAAILSITCAADASDVAVIWTDRPEIAFHAMQFNASHPRHGVEVFFRADPAQDMRAGGDLPDIVIAGFLPSAGTRDLFAPLDHLLEGDDGIEDAFYPRLMATGRVGGAQMFLPVSFSAPMAVFPRGHPGLSNPLTIGTEEMRELGGAFNARNAGGFTRMGFSPTWNDDFLFTAATLHGASFAEAAPLTWNASALTAAVGFMGEWLTDTNTGTAATANFTYRFFTLPPPAMVTSGRILFAYMDAADFLTIPESRRTALDFRWLANGDEIPMLDGAVFLGMTGRGDAPRAAAEFARWFFRAETQREMLERSHAFGQMEVSFGIVGGFSALRPVTEQVFPHLYPELLGRIPPADFLSPPPVLPADWPAMKERVVLPYLR